MNKTVIRVENVCKQYRLGKIGTGTFAHDLNRLWHTMRGKDDPYLKLGEENDRAKKGIGEYVWALKDISFDVQQGDVVGIIGQNGAGKSTLLKILSRTTLPTSGSLKIKGRIASLLEVGTGFHPELTGRENIFLNGAILGMRKDEIKHKFDEIVDFSGVEKYIDTPVKRYSSGMYVRLAFAVAAHLEPEILIVDEVLAVGDAEFQKKALGKMKDVSRSDGRTILFVSHNLVALNSLCRTCIYIKNGKLLSQGKSAEIIEQYINLAKKEFNGTSKSWIDIGNVPGDNTVKLFSARIIDEKEKEKGLFDIKEKIGIEMVYQVLTDKHIPVPNVHVTDSKGEYVFVTICHVTPDISKPGIHKAIVWIHENFLNVGVFNIGIAICTYYNPMIKHCFEQDVLSFETIEDMRYRDNNFNLKYPGLIRPKLKWEQFIN